MSNSRVRRAGRSAGLAALSAALLGVSSGQAAAAPEPAAAPAPDAAVSLDMMGGSMHAAGGHADIPAGVYGAGMVGAGKLMVAYTPMFMRMEDNYIGADKVSPETIVTTVPSGTTMSGMMGAMPVDYRIVPTWMTAQGHMLHLMYGLSDSVDLMVMGAYLQKTMRMETFAGMAGTTVLGSTKASLSGIGDTSVNVLWRVHQDGVHHLHLALGLSLPTASNTRTIDMLTPMGTQMTMRASYGMQLGTGTVDLLPAVTYTGHSDAWSWGAAYRGRLPLDKNAQHYRFGDQHELTGWGGYAWVPGVTTTVRVDGLTQGRIRGADPAISGLMQGANPRFYGGDSISLFGGVEIGGMRFGVKGARFAVEAGAPVYQDLNGPQLGRAWQVNAALAKAF